MLEFDLKRVDNQISRTFITEVIKTYPRDHKSFFIQYHLTDTTQHNFAVSCGKEISNFALTKIIAGDFAQEFSDVEFEITLLSDQNFCNTEFEIDAKYSYLDDDHDAGENVEVIVPKRIEGSEFFKTTEEEINAHLVHEMRHVIQRVFFGMQLS